MLSEELSISRCGFLMFCTVSVGSNLRQRCLLECITARNGEQPRKNVRDTGLT